MYGMVGHFGLSNYAIFGWSGVYNIALSFIHIA